MVAYSSSQQGGYYLNNLVSVAEYLMQNGYTATAAAGIAGDIAGESSGYPDAGNPETNFGLIQWTPPSKAGPYPIDTGNVSTDFTNQLADILQYNDQQGQTALEALNAATSPTDAADIYSQEFERPAVTDSDVRPDVASYVYAAVEGQPTSGILGSGGSTNATLTSSNSFNPLSLLFSNTPLTSIPGALGSGLSSAVGTSSLKDLLIRSGLILLGGILVVVGLFVMAGREIKTAVNIAAPETAVAGAAAKGAKRASANSSEG